jgi:hypothetical protein
VPRKRLIEIEKASAARETQSLIGQKLSAYYDLAQPMPHHLAELLKQLAQQIDKSETETW